MTQRNASLPMRSLLISNVKVNGSYSTRERIGGVLISLSRPWARRWINHFSLWREAGETPAYGYLPSRRASPPLDRYQIMLLGDRDTCVWTTCPRLLPESGTAENENENKSNKKTDQLLMFCLAMALNISRPHFCLTLYLLTTLFSRVVKRGRNRGWRE